MCEICDNTSLKVNVKDYDPTHTMMLRNAWVVEMNRRFKQVAKEVTKLIVDDDFFGLHSVSDIRTFAIPNKSEKITSFLEWLRQVEDAVLLEMRIDARFGMLSQTPWFSTYLAKAYEQGSKRAQQELKKAGLSITLVDDFGIVYLNPVSIEKLMMLFTRAFSDLKGITTTMDTQISRILTQGLFEGQSPIKLARMINSAIIGGGESLGLDISYVNKAGKTVSYFMPGRRRAEILARTEIIRSHHHATIDEYRTWAVEGVYVLAEWSTAGDNRVCIKCSSLQGTIWSLDEIEEMIPRHPQCFIDPQVPIYTSRGWKHIGDIVVGDRVLTHNKRFRKVTALVRGKQVSDVVKFKFKGSHTLSVTANHPILVTTNGKLVWRKAGKITTNDTVSMLANKCARCGKLTPYSKKYCSHSCLSKDITEKQWADPKHRENVSKKNSMSNLKQYESGERDRFTITKKANEKTRQMVKDGTFGTWMDEEFFDKVRSVTNTKPMRRASSKRMKLNNPMSNPDTVKKATMTLIKTLEENPEKRLNTRMAKLRCSGKMTWIEQRMANLLDTLGIDYVTQYPILRFNVDFALPTLKLVIECDGEQWHQDKRKDRIRQRKIEKEGWFVLRYTGKMINQCIDEIGKEVKRVVNNHTGKYNLMNWEIERIEKYTTKRKQPTYNLTVEEDESYIAKGIVVHNCRCVSIPYVDLTRTQVGGDYGLR